VFAIMAGVPWTLLLQALEPAPERSSLPASALVTGARYRRRRAVVALMSLADGRRRPAKLSWSATIVIAASLSMTRILPGSTLLGSLRADHLMIGVPVARDMALARQSIGRNAFGRETLLEAILKYAEEDLMATGTADSALPHSRGA
jgi:hypothetical protein